MVEVAGVRHQISPRVKVTLVASMLGLGVSIYLTVAHYGAPYLLTCPGGGAGHVVDCAKVTSSPQSEVFGIPVAVLGLAYFVPMFILSTPRAWRSTLRAVAPLRLVMVIVSIGFVSYLLYTELYVIHAICLWCSAVHVLTFIVFVAVVTGWDEAVESRRERQSTD